MRETERGNKYVLVIADYFSKFTIAWPLKSKKAEIVARKLLQTYAILAAPEYVLTDNGNDISFSHRAPLSDFVSSTGSEFKNSVNAAVERLFGIKHRYARHRCPKTVGHIENTNKQLKKYVSLSFESWKTVFNSDFKKNFNFQGPKPDVH